MNIVSDRARSRRPRFSGVRTGLPGRRLRRCEGVTKAPHRLLLQAILAVAVLALTPGAARADMICTGGAQYPSVSIQVDNSLSTPGQYYGNNCPTNSVSSNLTGSNSDSFPGGSSSATDSGTAAIGNLSASGTATGTGDEGGNITVETSFNDSLMITGPSGTLEFAILFDPVGSVSTMQDVTNEGGVEATMSASFEASDLSVAFGNETVCIEAGQVCSGDQGTASLLMGTVSTQAGDEIDLYAEMVITALADGTYYCNPTVAPCLDQVSASASAAFDGQFYVEALTPGAGYTSLSGVDYSSIPEPGSVVLLGSGLLGLLVWIGARRLSAVAEFHPVHFDPEKTSDR